MFAPLRALVLVPALAVTGCVTDSGASGGLFATTITKEQYANITAGAVGCPAKEITISGEKSTFGIGDQVTPWNAECRGHRFICSATGQTATCTEELKAAEAPAPAPAKQATGVEL
ncbi:MAG TPA: hypothetical protein VFO83_00115 [Aggregicoccus sp.]|nr:hypothetical protein [Aggregicoccus sp.]